MLPLFRWCSYWPGSSLSFLSNVKFRVGGGGGGNIARSEKVALPTNWCGYEIGEEVPHSTVSVLYTLVYYKYTFYYTNELILESDGHNFETNTWYNETVHNTVFRNSRFRRRLISNAVTLSYSTVSSVADTSSLSKIFFSVFWNHNVHYRGRKARYILWNTHRCCKSSIFTQRSSLFRFSESQGPRVYLNVLQLISRFYSYLGKALEMFPSARKHSSLVTFMFFIARRSCIS